MSFRLTARAEADLDEIDDYVASEWTPSSGKQSPNA